MYFFPKLFNTLALGGLLMSHGYAADAPSDLSALTEQDLRLQTGDIQSQPDDVRQQIFDHYLIKLETAPQQWTLIDTARVSQEILPPERIPTFDLPLPILLHVYSIADGLQSDDPRLGLYRMIDPVVNPNSPIQYLQQAPQIQLNLGVVSIGTIEQQMNVDGLMKMFLLTPH